MSHGKKYFTLVFEGDLSSYAQNPHRTETPFGIPVASGVGNAFDEIEELLETINARDAEL